MDKIDALTGAGGPVAVIYNLITNKKNKEDIVKMEAAVEQIKDEYRDLKIYMAENFATKDSVEKLGKEIKSQISHMEDKHDKSFSRIESKLDGKADK